MFSLVELLLTDSVSTLSPISESGVELSGLMEFSDCELKSDTFELLLLDEDDD